jgi:hypothetical protein
MQHDKKPVPDWLLERLALGELDADTAADVRRRLAAEGRSVDDVMAAVATSNQEILAEHGATPTVAAIRQRAARAAAAQRPARKGAFLWVAPLVLAGGAAALMVVQPWQRGKAPDASGAREYIGIKGDDPSKAPPRLYIYRHRDDGDQRLTDGARAGRGDLVQLAYGSHSGGYGVLLSIDGARRVTLHWPERPEGNAPALKAAGETRLPSAYELDDAPAFERFFLIRSQSPFSVATAIDAAHVLATQPSARKQSLALPPGFEQISLALDKTHAGQPSGQKEQP